MTYVQELICSETFVLSLFTLDKWKSFHTGTGELEIENDGSGGNESSPTKKKRGIHAPAHTTTLLGTTSHPHIVASF
jgi:hypothetical protein